MTGNNELEPGPWGDAFTIDGTLGGAIELRQIKTKSFILDSDICYEGETGLEGKVKPETIDKIKGLKKGIETDLASVPGPLRWFLGTYGRHTPAVLIHDQLIPTPTEYQGEMTDQYADRYLRFMAKAVGIRWLKRWMMWTGVALRTRWAGGWKSWSRWSVILWVLAAVFGIATFASGLADGNMGRMALAVLGIFAAAGLWGNQYGAGVIGGLTAPWLLPPTILAIVGLGIYAAGEFLLGLVLRFLGKSDVRGSGSYGADGF